MAVRPRRRALVPGYEMTQPLLMILADHTEYLGRVIGEEPGDTKAFAGRHAAGRSALAHAEQLIKIAALVGADDDAPPSVAALLAEARADLDGQAEDSESDDAGGAG